MKQDFLAGLVSRMKALDQGGYDRTYGNKGRAWRTSTSQLISNLLDSLKVRYEENVAVEGLGNVRADFLVNRTWVFVERELTPAEQRALAAKKKSVLIVNRDPL